MDHKEKKNEQGIRQLLENFKPPNIQIIGVLKEGQIEKIFGEIWLETFKFDESYKYIDPRSLVLQAEET